MRNKVGFVTFAARKCSAVNAFSSHIMVTTLMFARFFLQLDGRYGAFRSHIIVIGLIGYTKPLQNICDANKY